MKETALTGQGSPDALGVTVAGAGVDVSVYSTDADSIAFCLFDRRGGKETARIPLGRTGEVFHGHISGVAPGARYGLRADGPYDPSTGRRFDPHKLLVDPYARQLDRPFAWATELAAPRSAAIDTAHLVPKAIVTGAPDVAPARRPHPAPGDRVIYELGVKSFTMLNPAIPRRERGTFAALAHPASIEHLVRLGVTTVELMPVAAWIDERHLPPLGLANAWGYNPIAFATLDPRLAPHGPGDLRQAVDALHDAGIEVILDVVFNHTGESDEFGATLSLRGLDNAAYYRLDPSDRSRYVNDTGCGNTLALDRPPAMRLVLDTLRYFAASAGIDGFRFDLAPVLGRRDDGFDRNAPLLAAIGEDPVLKDRFLVAEPWDVGPGGYQLGAFPSRWGEWNDRYRDDVRRFWRGEPGTRADLATRLAGSADIFRAGKPGPAASINFVAAHDGFSLADLVAHEGKHNAANGEGNRDGTDRNFSWNNGAEGETDDRSILEARRRDMKALLATLLVSRGVPMLTAGDEMGRTQAGNNNAYAQDNPITWIDWENGDDELISYVARLIRLRRNHAALRDDRFLTGLPAEIPDIADVSWLDADGRPMQEAAWRSNGKTLGMTLSVRSERLAIWFNGADVATEIPSPAERPGRRWTLAPISTRDSPDISGEDRLKLPPRSVTLVVETDRTAR